MNAPVEKAHHFMYYPGNYRWSAEMLVVVSTAPYGGADFAEADRVGRQLRDCVGDDDAWFKAWCTEADLLRTRARAAEEAGHPLTAASNYLRSCFYYQIGDHFRQPKDNFRAVGTDTVPAGQREFEAASQAITVDRGNAGAG